MAKEKGVEVLHLYDEAIAFSELKFLPAATCDTVYYVDLNDKQKAALKNISKYYTGPQRQESIMIKSAEYLEITDDDAVGAFAIIKSKEKPTNWGNHKIYNLGNDWWQVKSTAR